MSKIDILILYQSENRNITSTSILDGIWQTSVISLSYHTTITNPPSFSKASETCLSQLLTRDLKVCDKFLFFYCFLITIDQKIYHMFRFIIHFKS